jgi:hypothetical protein
LGVSRREALGLAVEWLCWLDSVSSDGSTGLTAELIDTLFFNERLSQDYVTSVTGCHKMSQALVAIGWLDADENGQLYAVNFEKHNGESAKKRTEAAERQRLCRARRLSQKTVTPITESCDQIREEKNIEKIASKEATKKTTTDKKTTLPETSDEVLLYLSSLPNCALKGDELLTCAETFFNQSEAVGWTLSGQPVRDWRASARAFLARWQNNNASRAAAAPRGKITYRSQTQQNYEL